MESVRSDDGGFPPGLRARLREYLGLQPDRLRACLRALAGVVEEMAQQGMITNEGSRLTMLTLLASGWTSAELGAVVWLMCAELVGLEDSDRQAMLMMVVLDHLYVAVVPGSGHAFGWERFDADRRGRRLPPLLWRLADW